MTYWKGVLYALTFDVALIAGCQFLATEPVPPSRSEVVAWPPALDDSLTQQDRYVDSLMTHLQEQPADVDAMLALARFYLDHDGAEPALGPLARALELEPHRRSLWVALDRALDGTGRAKITDAELVRAALEFVEMMESWGHGC